MATFPFFQLGLVATGHTERAQNIGLIVMLITVVLLLVLGRRPQWLHLFTIATYVIGTTVIVVALFVPEIYGNMLWHIRFGGGMPIELVRNCQSTTPCDSVLRSNLFLRTENYFLLIDNATHEVTEIPASSVVQYRYLATRRWGAE
jgi:hypothetical protein